MAKFTAGPAPTDRASPLHFIGGKPRIYRRHGIWCCLMPGTRGPIGCGYAPRTAYEDFIEQVAYPRAA
jgi:hypothetical protein